MDLDFSDVPDVDDFVTVPAGSYVCRVAEVQPGATRNGHDRWGLRLVVAEGEFTGRQAAWDGLVFTERGMARARRVFAAFGLPSEGRVKVEPDDLVGREALVVVQPSEYEDPRSGSKVRRNEVPYDGYRAVPADGSMFSAPPPAPDDDAIPF